MSISQIERFVGESIEQCRKWIEIVLEGGEPTLHPQLPEILKILLDYRKKYSPRTNIKILTNGYGEEAKKAVASLPRLDIDIFNSRKTSIVQKHHCAFNVAPCDLPEFQNTDFSEGCYLPACYGLGLTRYGYYPHPICGGIDRVFGFDVGRNSLPSPNDPMMDQFSRLCSFCGFFRYNYYLKRKIVSVENDQSVRMSSTWQLAYSQYAEKKPILTEYR